MNVIAVGRSEERLKKLHEEFASAGQAYKLLTLEYDFSVKPLEQFATTMEDFLKSNGIDRNQIGFAWINAGYGEVARFTGTSVERKLAFMRVNFEQHMVLSDYFSKLFVERNKQLHCRSGLAMTASQSSFMPIKGCSMYFVAKASVSNLAAVLSAELSTYDIDVIAVHPTAIRDTRFHVRPEMCPNGTQILQGGFLIDKTPIAVSPKQVVDTVFSHIGKICCCNCGVFSDVEALALPLGRNILSKICQHGPEYEDIVNAQ